MLPPCGTGEGRLMVPMQVADNVEALHEPPHAGRDAFHRVPDSLPEWGRGGTRPYRVQLISENLFPAGAIHSPAQCRTDPMVIRIIRLDLAMVELDQSEQRSLGRRAV